MGRPPKYNWEPIDRLLEAGLSPREVSKETGIPRQSIEMRIRRQARPPETCPTEEALKSQIYCNQMRELLKDLERKSRDNVKLAIALQVESARFLTGSSNIRASDLAHVANVISSLEKVGTGISGEEVFGTIAAMMRLGWLDEETSAQAVVRIRESRDAVLEDLWRIVNES